MWFKRVPGTTHTTYFSALPFSKGEGAESSVRSIFARYTEVLESRGPRKAAFKNRPSEESRLGPPGSNWVSNISSKSHPLVET